MSKDKLIPELRFPEFKNEGEWHTDYLGKIANNVTTGKLDANAMVENGKYRFYTCAKNYYRINDYAFDTEAILIAGNGAYLGYIHHYKGKFNAYQRTYVLSDFSKSVLYLKYYLERFLPSQIASEKKEGNTPYIVLGTITDMVVLFPENPKEQKALASCLSSLDEVIAAQCEKLELLKNHKKGLMQNLFPQEGETVPKYRFKEFENDGEWVEKKLGEVTEIGRGKSKHRPRDESSLFGGIYPFIQTGDIRKANLYLTDYTQTYSEKGLKQSKLWDENTLCVTIAANIAETAILKIKACFPDSVIGIIHKKDITEVLFINYLIENFKLQIQSFSQGMAQDNLNQEKLSNLVFLFPKIQEQQKIASCLSSLDALITAQADKIEQLKLHKKGLMQGLFPKIIAN